MQSSDPIQSNPIQSNPWMDPIHVQLCNNIVSYAFLGIRRACVNIQLNVHYCVLFSSSVRVRIRVRLIFSVAWLISCYAHVFVRLKVVIVKFPETENRNQKKIYA